MNTPSRPNALLMALNFLLTGPCKIEAVDVANAYAGLRSLVSQLAPKFVAPEILIAHV